MRSLEPTESGNSSPAGTGWTPGPPSSSSGSNGNGATLYGNGSSNGGGGAPYRGGNSGGAVLARVPVPATQVVAVAASEAAAAVRARGGAAAGWDAQAGGALAMDTDFKWARDSYSKTQRTIDTWTFFLAFRSRLYLLDQKWSYVGGFTEEKKSARAKGLARYLVQSILDLGPTFIKIGQLSSTRSDLFPAAFVEELAKLQDRVPAFSSDKAAAIIERDLGRPIPELFAEFDARPIAAASLGQVHRAVLHSGQEVVVKVQRPGLKQLFDIDLENLRLLAEQLDRGEEGRDFKGIYEECASVLYEEIDYINEGRNADRFRRNFRDVEWVKAPVVHWEYCSSRVLTLEYLPGVKVSDRARLETQGLDAGLVAQRATEAYLIQILKHGFFHADPHPGNVAVDSAGRLLYYDFGMMGTIPGNVKDNLMEVFYGIYRKDTGQVVDALTQLGVIRATGDRLSVRRAIAFFLDNLQKQLEREETLGAIGEDLFAIALDSPFRFPATFTFVLRAFSTLEGIGKTLVPTYRFSDVAQPYASELLQLQDASAQQEFVFSQLQQQATELGQAAAAMPTRVAAISDTIDQLTAGDLKLRVRDLEGERAARRAGILQSATLNVVGSVGLLNLGAQLSLSGAPGPGGAVFGAAGVFGVLTLLGLRRVQRLDKFEKDLRK
ncbi:MAG: ABC1 family-domain-containing protein [Monoraphidium minutum]|nr:MAG: ABC1 family-domain-containing protein [Monoraphidium minutum]